MAARRCVKYVALVVKRPPRRLGGCHGVMRAQHRRMCTNAGPPKPKPHSQAGGGGARPEAETKPPPRPAGWPVQPPLPVRSAIVGTTVGLATPLFPVVGFVRAVRYFVPDATLRIMMYGGTGVLLSFAVRDLLPFMYQHAPLLAPFALVNAAVAGAMYTVLDVVKGGPQALLKLGRWTRVSGSFVWPVVGVGIGLVTAVLAPYLYLDTCLWHFGVELEPDDLAAVRRFYPRVVDTLLPVSAFTGAVAGAIIQPAITPLLVGVGSVSWPMAAGVGLAVLGACTLYTFRTGATEHVIVSELDPAAPLACDGCSDDGGVPAAVVLSPAQAEELRSVPRLHVTSGAIGSATADNTVADDGGALAQRGMALRDALRVRANAGSRGGDGSVVFRSHGVAELAKMRKRFPLLELATAEPTPVTVPSAEELRWTPGVVTDAVARTLYLSRARRGDATTRPATQLAAANVVAEEVTPIQQLMRKRRKEDVYPRARTLLEPAGLDRLATEAAAALALYRLKQAAIDGEAGLGEDSDVDVGQAFQERAAMARAGWKIRGGMVDIAELDAVLRPHDVDVSLVEDYHKHAVARTHTRRLQAAAITAVLAALAVGVAKALRQ